MCIDLIKQSTYSKKDIIFMQNHKNEYSQEGFSKDVFINLDVMKNDTYYQIKHCAETIGFIILVKKENFFDDERELIIGIYEEYQNKRYASKAIEKLFDILKGSNLTIYVCIRESNPRRTILIKWLERLEFVRNIDDSYMKNTN